MPDLRIFELEFENNIVKFEIGTHWFCLIAKHREIMEMPKFRTKNVLFRYIWAWILKNYWHIWNQRPRTCHKRIFNSYSEFWYRVWKCLNFGPKMLYFGIFGLEFTKNYCHIWNQRLQSCRKRVFNSCSEFWYRVRSFWRSGSRSGSAL